MVSEDTNILFWSLLHAGYSYQLFFLFKLNKFLLHFLFFFFQIYGFKYCKYVRIEIFLAFASRIYPALNLDQIKWNGEKMNWPGNHRRSDKILVWMDRRLRVRGASGALQVNRWCVSGASELLLPTGFLLELFRPVHCINFTLANPLFYSW